jgi:hypothetical protein
LSSLVADVLAGKVFELTSTPPTGYTRQFQHKDWIDFVDPVERAKTMASTNASMRSKVNLT